MNEPRIRITRGHRLAAASVASVLVACGADAPGGDASWAGGSGASADASGAAAAPGRAPTTTADAAPDGARDESTGAAVAARFTADTTTDFPNPERGFFYQANDGLLGGSQFADDLDVIKAQGYRLAQANTNLAEWKTQSIPQAALDTMASNLAVTRAKGMKLIVRFAYDFNGATNPDTSLSWVQAHAAQLGAVLAAHRDVLYVVQAGFIGMWGEWHSSGASGLDSKANKRAVKDAVLAMVPADIPVQFTNIYAMQEDWFPTVLGPAEAFNGSDKARSGFHNDCFMASGNDRYQFPGPATAVDFTFTKTQAEQRQYAATLTELAPYGGETCTGPELRLACRGGTDGAGQAGGILNEGPRYHLAYLNRGYYSAFEDRWVSDGCYDTVSRSMGYRFQLDGVSHQGSASRGQQMTVAVELRNVGWSRIFSARSLRVMLVNGSSTLEGDSAALLRTLPSQAQASGVIPVRVAIPANAAPGSYAVYLAMPDRYPTTADGADYAIRPANAASGAQAWDAAHARFATGTSVIVD